MIPRLLATLGLCLTLVGPAGAAPRAELSLIGAYEVPSALAVDGAPFGGISGVDYDPKSGTWVMISDDKSDLAPARFYTARLDYDAGGVRGLRLEASTALRREDGSSFPSTKSGPGERADSEAIRRDPQTGVLVWSTEGDKPRGLDPAVRRMTSAGAFVGDIPLPPRFHFDPAGASGPRVNQTVEGLSFTPDGRSLWVSMEGPLIQDGPAASVADGGQIRITRLDRAGAVLAQYAYRLDPVQAAPAIGKRADNGVSEILAVDDHRLLVLERSGVEDAQGRFAFHCRLYLVDVRGAPSVADAPSLAGRSLPPLAKRLMVNFDRLAGVTPSNLEGMAWGRTLADGGRTLVLASDDNFDARAPTQFVVFRYAPRPAAGRR